MTYGIFLYDDSRKSFGPIRILANASESQIEQSRMFYRNDSRCLPEWQSYVIYEYDDQGYPTLESWTFNKGNRV